MKTTEKTVKGTAFMVGGSKEATEALIAGVVAIVPKARQDEVKATLKAKLLVDFEFKTTISEPESLEEAIDMLPSGRESMTKMVISKAITNQMDKLRLDYAKSLVESANIAEVIATIQTK